MRQYFAIYSALVVATIMTSACSWKAKVLEPDKFSQMDEKTSGVLIPIDFQAHQANITTESCSFVVKPHGGGSTRYLIPFNFGDTQVFANLDPDLYYFQEVFCGMTHLDLRQQKVPEFMVIKNKISMIAGMKFSLDREMDRNYYFLFDKARSQKEMLKSLKSLPPRARQNVISGYSGKSIQESDLDSFTNDLDSNVNAVSDKTGKPIPIPSSVLNEVRECKLIEAQRNPLVFGNVVIEAEYSKKTLQKLDPLPSWNIMNQELTNCLMTAVSKVHPEGTQDQKVKFTF